MSDIESSTVQRVRIENASSPGSETDPLFVRQALPPEDSFFHKFGAHDSVASDWCDSWHFGTAANRDVWYVPAGCTPEAVSSSAADTGTLTIGGTDVSGAFQTDTVALNGTTKVSFTKVFSVVHRCYYNGGSLSGVNAGNITISDPGTSDPMCYIYALAGQSEVGFLRVPTDYVEVELLKYRVGSGRGDEIEHRIFWAPPGGSWRVLHSCVTYDGASGDGYEWGDAQLPESGLELEPGSFIKIMHKAVSGTRAFGSFSLELDSA